MRPPVLLLGYEGSGVELLRRIVSMCPAFDNNLVFDLDLSLSKIRNDHTLVQKLVEENVDASLFAGAAFAYTAFSQALSQLKGFRFFCKFCLRPPLDQIAVIHVSRSPLFAINSRMHRHPSFGECLRSYFSSVPRVIELLDKEPFVRASVLWVRFEDLTERPTEEVRRIYSWLGYDVDQSHIDSVLSIKLPWFDGKRTMLGLGKFDRIMRYSSSLTPCRCDRRKIREYWHRTLQRYEQYVRPI